MSRYLLDTDALISFSKQYEPVFSFISKAIENNDELGVSPINLAEFYSGLPEQALAIWDDFFESMEFWPISQQAAKQAGRWRYTHSRAGKTLTTTDMLIAAVAKEKEAILVTGNAKDYPLDEIELLTLQPEHKIKKRRIP